VSGGAYERYRYTFPDGRAKDWAIRTNPDGTCTTRWGPADRLTGTLTRAERYPGEAAALTLRKLRKGYVPLDRVELDGCARLTPRSAPWPTGTRSNPPHVDLSRVDTGRDDFWF
jgi:hypothetical protein